jgi:hypothetical protein
MTDRTGNERPLNGPFVTAKNRKCGAHQSRVHRQLFIQSSRALTDATKTLDNWWNSSAEEGGGAFQYSGQADVKLR